MKLVKETSVSQKLQKWLSGDTDKTVGSLQLIFDDRIFAVLFVVLMLTAALPIPTGGITHIFEIIVMLLSLELVIGRSTLWLPQKWLNLKFGKRFCEKAIPFLIRKLSWLERHSQPRGTWFYKQKLSRNLFGLLIITFTFGAFFSPPFSGLDTLPAWGVLLVSISYILEDFLYLIAGLFFGMIGITLELFFAAQVIAFVAGLFN
jgi:hypothetical protein